MSVRCLVAALALPLLACGKSTPPEPTGAAADPANAPVAKSSPPPAVSVAQGTPATTVAVPAEPGEPGATPVSASSSNATGAAATGTVVKHGGNDPLDGKWTVADATKDLKGTGPLVATIETSKGTLTCSLYDDKAPNTVANFVGLARGTRPWKDPKDDWVKRPAYDGTTFHRVIKGFMIQGGDPRGNGTGEPGYVIKDELWTGAKHDRAGLLCMANRGHDTNGAQFFITDAAAAHLDGNYTIFGECAPEKTVHDIADVPVAGSAPTTPVTIAKVTIAHGEKKAK